MGQSFEFGVRLLLYLPGRKLWRLMEVSVPEIWVVSGGLVLVVGRGRFDGRRGCERCRCCCCWSVVEGR